MSYSSYLFTVSELSSLAFAFILLISQKHTSILMVISFLFFCIYIFNDAYECIYIFIHNNVCIIVCDIFCRYGGYYLKSRVCSWYFVNKLRTKSSLANYFVHNSFKEIFQRTNHPCFFKLLLYGLICGTFTFDLTCCKCNFNGLTLSRNMTYSCIKQL